MKNKTKETYENYMKQIGDRKKLYSVVSKEFNVDSGIYPGSHVDITPSLVIPNMTYIDNFRGTVKFFSDMQSIRDYINEHKEYKNQTSINFFNSDYTKPLNLEKVDIIISQYAGFVGQATKQYLKLGGILLCNDSHGDATLAHIDEDYKLIATVNSSNKIDYKNLDKYFVLSKCRSIDIEFVKQKMKGLKYIVNAQNYIFKKIK